MPLTLVQYPRFAALAVFVVTLGLSAWSSSAVAVEETPPDTKETLGACLDDVCMAQVFEALEKPYDHWEDCEVFVEGGTGGSRYDLCHEVAALAAARKWAPEPCVEAGQAVADAGKTNVPEMAVVRDIYFAFAPDTRPQTSFPEKKFDLSGTAATATSRVVYRHDVEPIMQLIVYFCQLKGGAQTVYLARLQRPTGESTRATSDVLFEGPTHRKQAAGWLPPELKEKRLRNSWILDLDKDGDFDVLAVSDVDPLRGKNGSATINACLFQEKKGKPLDHCKLLTATFEGEHGHFLSAWDASMIEGQAPFVVSSIDVGGAVIERYFRFKSGKLVSVTPPKKPGDGKGAAKSSSKAPAKSPAKAAPKGGKGVVKSGGAAKSVVKSGGKAPTKAPAKPKGK
jgi:hypothetical protein